MGLRCLEIAPHVIVRLLKEGVYTAVTRLPKDVEVVHVYTMGAESNAPPNIRINLKSEEWEGPEQGELIPLLEDQPEFKILPLKFVGGRF